MKDQIPSMKLIMNAAYPTRKITPTIFETFFKFGNYEFLSEKHP